MSSAANCIHGLHTIRTMRRRWFNRAFALVYTCAILALFYGHAQALLHSTTLLSSSIALSLLSSDVVLAFMWLATQPYRMNPVRRTEFPENLEKVVNRTDFPRLDVFICTADPYKEPPMNVVNTALSVLAYDYPPEKVSVYVSDDGGSELTLFAFTEAARFASYWLPFCRNNNVVDRNPEVYFTSHAPFSSQTENIKQMYESMKTRVENVVGRGKVDRDHISTEELKTFQRWTDKFTLQDHPTVIQVLLEKNRDKDVTGHGMPNLIYVTREKSSTSPHHFKAGALNVLIRVSAIMTNAPVILTLDCDMYSNDPQTPTRALCYLCDPAMVPTLAFVQFPQDFRGTDKNDIYACEYRRLFKINPVGIDGLRGPNYVGTGCFFRRRALFGPPSSFVSPEMPQLSPTHKPIHVESVLANAYHVASCDYEKHTEWGSKMGCRYGSLVEDYYTGYRLNCEGWRSIFCYPEKAAFLGDVPICLIDVLNQNKRWAIGLLDVTFSKYSTITHGVRSMGPLMGLAYSCNAFWPSWSIPISVYAFLPQLAFLNGLTLLPKASEARFLLYMFLVLGAYGQDLFEFVSDGGTVQRWWNDQRMWLIRGVTSYIFGTVEFTLRSLGITKLSFNVTSKVLDDDQTRRYLQGTFDFGVPSPMLVPLAMAAIINLWALSFGVSEVARGKRNLDQVVAQTLLSGFAVVNCWPVYEAMVLRSDKGMFPRKVTLVSVGLTWALCALASNF